jgi:hypothetical protein
VLELASNLFHRCICHRTVETPADGAGGVDHQQVGIIRSVESGSLLPLLLSAVNQHETVVQFFWSTTLDAAGNHAAKQAGNVFDHRDGPRWKAVAHAQAPRLGLILEPWVNPIVNRTECPPVAAGSDWSAPDALFHEGAL